MGRLIGVPHKIFVPFQHIPDALDFLAEKFQAGLKYHSLNCYRSALSSALIPIDGFHMGQHPLVVRLMKGVFNSRPPEPRYTVDREIFAWC